MTFVPDAATQRPRSRRRSQTADEAAAANPDILCHQIGLCKNLAELQALISKHSLLNVETDPRFDDRMKVVIEAALDTMTEVLQVPPEGNRPPLFVVPADLARQGWVLERDGVVFKLLNRDHLVTSGYVILDEAFDAARKLQRREGKRGGGSGVVENGDAPASPEANEGSAYEGQDAAALLAATEREQRGRWQALVSLGFERDKAKGKKRDRLDGEIKGLREIYVATWHELSDALSPQAANDLRNRVESLESPPVSADPATSGDNSEAATTAAVGDVVEDTPAIETTPAVESAPAEPYTVSHRFTQPLRVRLTSAEIAAKCDQLDRALSNLEQLQQRFEAVKETFKGDIKNAEGVVDGIEKVLRRKSEEREGDCEERLYQREACVVRLDTGEVVSRRPLKPEEREGSLFAA